uniref:BRCC36_C domain-containing protein n=1 Tax=Schistocephalus solidus TaxID=70667 RepID=A0A183SNY5_SCHSO
LCLNPHRPVNLYCLNYSAVTDLVQRGVQFVVAFVSKVCPSAKDNKESRKDKINAAASNFDLRPTSGSEVSNDPATPMASPCSHHETLSRDLFLHPAFSLLVTALLKAVEEANKQIAQIRMTVSALESDVAAKCSEEVRISAELYHLRMRLLQGGGIKYLERQ